jgi:PIN domain nuclease of toxin-antitoxin system
MNYALDASAMIAFVSAEPGGDLVEQLLGGFEPSVFRSRG